MIILILGLLGLCLGSFVDASVWRMHKQEEVKVRKTKKYSILKGRSMCPHCEHTLAASDLIPVLSWIELRGRCRYCRKPIGLEPLFVELSTAAVFALSYVYWPYEFGTAGLVSFVCWLILLTGFMALIIYDIKWMILPNKIVYPMIAFVALETVVLSLIIRTPEPITAALIGVLCSSGLFYILFQISGGKWIGGGDVKLAVVLGALVGGPVQSILLLFVASLLGSLVSIPLLLVGKNRKHQVPFGPFLIIATILVYLWGATITSWYEHQFLA